MSAFRGGVIVVMTDAVGRGGKRYMLERNGDDSFAMRDERGLDSIKALGYIPAERTVAEAPGLEMPRRSEGIGVFLSHPFWRKLRQLHAVQRELALSLACRKLALELGLGTKGDHKVFERLFSSVRARSVPS